MRVHPARDAQGRDVVIQCVSKTKSVSHSLRVAYTYNSPLDLFLMLNRYLMSSISEYRSESRRSCPGKSIKIISTAVWRLHLGWLIEMVRLIPILVL